MTIARRSRRSVAFQLLCECLSTRSDRDLADRAAAFAGSDGSGWTDFVDLATDHLVAPLVARRFEKTGQVTSSNDNLESEIS